MAARAKRTFSEGVERGIQVAFACAASLMAIQQVTFLLTHGGDSRHGDIVLWITIFAIESYVILRGLHGRIGPIDVIPLFANVACAMFLDARLTDGSSLGGSSTSPMSTLLLSFMVAAAMFGVAGFITYALAASGLYIVARGFIGGTEMATIAAQECVLGLCTIIAGLQLVRLLRSTALEADRVQELRTAAEAVEAVIRETALAAVEARRVVHDDVIVALYAIGRASTLETNTVQQACADAIESVRSLGA